MRKIRILAAMLLSGAVLAALTGPAPALLPASSGPGSWASTTFASSEDVGLNPWWFDALNIAKAHEQTRGEGVTVAVIDSALNMEAADLQGANITLKTTSLGEPARSYPDAFYAAHGTAVTTVIAGQGGGTNGPGIVGVAPEAEILFYQRDPDPYTEESQTSTELIYEALSDGADIINLSYSGSGLEHQEAIQLAHEVGVVVVAAAGSKDGRGLDEPANTRGVVAVGALDRDGRAWEEQPAQEEAALTVSAPGVDVPTGWMEGPPRGARWVSGQEATGTSFAAPIVSGMLALVKSRYPEATGDQLIQHLIHFVGGAKDESTWQWRRDSGFGSASATRMLERDPAGWPDENPLLIQTIEDIMTTYPFESYGQDDGGAVDDEPTPAANESATDADLSGIGSTLMIVAIIGLFALVVLTIGTALVLRRRNPSDDHTSLHQET